VATVAPETKLPRKRRGRPGTTAADQAFARAEVVPGDSIGALRLAVARGIVAEYEDADTAVVPDTAAHDQVVRPYGSRSAAASRPGPAAAAGSGRRSGHHRSVSIATPTPTAHPPTMSDG
jgi:hypothetical protein